MTGTIKNDDNDLSDSEDSVYSGLEEEEDSDSELDEIREIDDEAEGEEEEEGEGEGEDEEDEEEEKGYDKEGSSDVCKTHPCNLMNNPIQVSLDNFQLYFSFYYILIFIIFHTQCLYFKSKISLL